MNLIPRKIFFPSLFICFTVLLFVLRVLAFAEPYGGVEHDSGWYLGVAKNFALRGIYASYTNTIKEEEAGAYPSIHGRFSVQDNLGFSYFPAGVTVGPGYIVPQALLIKIFGDGFWQYRLWPLLTYTGLLLLLFFSVWEIGGFMALLVFQIWLWAIPQLYTAYAYESYSEHTALFYLLVSFLLFYQSYRPKNKYWLMCLSGLFLAFSVLTKPLFLLTGLALFIFLPWEAWIYRREAKTVFFRWGLFAVGFILPIFIFELYRYLFLVSHFGISAWRAINEDIRLTFQVGGSGVVSLNLYNLDPPFIFKKLNIWLDAGIKQPLLVWILLLPSVFVIKFVQGTKRALFILFYTSILFSFLWFIFLSPMGWARHAWQGIVLGMAVISIIFGLATQITTRNWQKVILPLMLFLTFVLSISVVRPESTEFKFFLNQETIEKWRMNRYVRGLEGLPSQPILSLVDQRNLINFFQGNINQEDRLYYIGWFLNAEISPLVDKVFYTLDRYFLLNQKNPMGGKSYAIFGPYQQGPWSFVPPGYLPRKIAELCELVVYRNSSYVLCILKTGLVYNNPAYE